MSVFKGKRLQVEIYGESHAQTIGVKASGFPRFKIDENELRLFMLRRKGGNGFTTARTEEDIPVFSGLEQNEIVGDFTAEISNRNIRKSDYQSLYGKPRPSHADYVWYVKDGVLDFSGGGRFSGRMTAPLCVVGGIALQYLQSLGINVCAYLSAVGTVQGKSYRTERISAFEIPKLRDAGGFPSLDQKAEMLACIENCKANGDSVGSKVECVISGLSAGVGDNLFGGLEGKISSLVYSIPGVKGVEFGDGFALANGYGSQTNDPFYMDDGRVRTLSNHAGGINGGVSNGNDITLSVALRPTPSISKQQQTVDLTTGEDTMIRIQGRHDPCLGPRAIPCVESAVAIALLDELL